MKKETQEQNRGELTDRIKKKSKELLDYEINVTELRLMPYIQYVVVNKYKCIENDKTNEKEVEIIKKWEDMGHIKNAFSDISISKKFWDIMNELLYLGYVDLKI